MGSYYDDFFNNLFLFNILRLKKKKKQNKEIQFVINKKSLSLKLLFIGVTLLLIAYIIVGIINQVVNWGDV